MPMGMVESVGRNIMNEDAPRVPEMPKMIETVVIV